MNPERHAKADGRRIAPMRQFIVLGHDVPTDGDFSLDDLPGTGGRVDLLARSVTSALLLSHGVREDTRVWLVLDDEYTIRFEGNEVQGLNPDERSTAARIRDALARREEAIGHEEVETGPGVFLSRRGLEPILEAAGAGGTLIQCHEDGNPLPELAPPPNATFVLSDHREFTDREADLIAEYADTSVSLGPAALHADHAISVVHNYLDTGGYADY